MSVTVDLITRKKLILVKQLYQQALIQSESQHSYVGRIMSLIGFDLSAETILKTIVAALEPAKTPADGFQGLIQQTDKLLIDAGLPSIPDKANIQHVHSLRNDAQHKAKYPNETDVADCRTYVRDFLHKIIFDVWGLSFEAVSLTDVIQRQEVKDYLVAAETALSKNDYEEALVKAEAGLRTAIGRASVSIVDSIDWRIKAFITTDGENAEPDRDTFHVFESMRDVLVRIALGLNVSDYRRYKQIVDSVIMGLAFFGNGKYQVAVSGREVKEKDAEFVVNYAINAVIQVESYAQTSFE